MANIITVFSALSTKSLNRALGKEKSTVLNGAVISCADTFLHLQILHVVWIIAAHHCAPSATPACFATR
jgi:hypothetical protein